MKINAQPTLEQKQTLSWNQTQSLAILAMSNDALDEFVRREQEENPLLEIPDVSEPRQWQEPADVTGAQAERDTYWNVAAPQAVSLQEHLLCQMDEQTMNKYERRATRFILDSLDESGYLTASVQEIAAVLRLPVSCVQRCVARVRGLDPAGVAADNLAQCLELQLARQGEKDETIRKIVRHHLEDIAAGRFLEIARSIGVSREHVQRCVDRIRTLNPRPASGFGPGGTQYVVPDLICRYQDNAWTVYVCDGWMGTVGLNRLYDKLLRAADEPEVQRYYAEKLARAKFVLASIEKRRTTLREIAEHVVARQTAYLLARGALAPYTFRQAAAELQVHESTISRGVRDKYIETPRGSMPLRALFTSALGADGAVSRDSALEAIRALIAAEDTAHPLSDQAIAERLAAENIHVSRRTVAKYRELSGIPSTAQRKRAAR